MFVLLSSFVLTIECHATLSTLFTTAEQVTPVRSAPKSNAWLPIASVFYGICPVTWSVMAFIIGTPLGSLWASSSRLGLRLIY
ncbi:MAG: hypothetical protein SGI72_03675 [Planctomycetota bacterium]|nr:hypothetical protein [Planctomycetota bacterium]